MDSNSQDVSSSSTTTPSNYSRRRVRWGLLLTLIGFAVFLLGTRPQLFSMDRSPIIGFVQIAVFLVGLAFMCLGGYMSIMALWKNHAPTLAADVGQRLVATGYLVAVFAGMADVFGFGSHPLPGVPYFGVWQARGVELGQAIIAIGFLLLMPYNLYSDKTRKNSSTESGSKPTADSIS
jgi:TRAP-type C4-dicarboxylate transport system permease small subunit